MPIVADIAHASQMREAADAVDAQWGRLDVVFANAGINGVWARIEELSPATGTRPSTRTSAARS